MAKVEIEVPEGYEAIIVKKGVKLYSNIKTYQDLIDNDVTLEGYYIDGYSSIINKNNIRSCKTNQKLATTEKVAKSMLAMAMISQLMPYYGGEITTKEWNDLNIDKYFIYKYKENIHTSITNYHHYYLAFHTEEQRNEFIKYNEQLVKDYLMID